MLIERTTLLDEPVETVFAWHRRPGALARLAPPWQPFTVQSEAASLRDGQAVLRLPGGLRWIATHDPDGYEENRRFVDVLTTPGLDALLAWRHTHLFEPAAPGRTRVTDKVECRLPPRLLEEMLSYRGRQLAGDLAAHHRWSSPGGRPLTVAVTGSSGLIGSALTALLTTGGHHVIRLVRSAPKGGERRWDPADPAGDLLEGVDAVVHLAGRSIAGRFDAAHKAEVRESRVAPTRRLAELAARSRLSTLVTASAIGFYGADRGDAELTEVDERGDGFLADLVSDWEAATDVAQRSGVRVAAVRTGIVQSPRGGSLRLLRALFEAGLGGRLGDGSQWMSWIGIDDVVDIYLRAVADPSIEGPLNAVSPEPVRNDEYTRTLARVLRRPAVIPVPKFAPALLLGREGAHEIAEASQRVVPSRLRAAGHTFRNPGLEGVLRHVLGRVGAGHFVGGPTDAPKP